MQAGVGLPVSDVMPIYMIIPRYSHNYAQFCQLLNNNLFTHRRILMLLREDTSETYGPRVSFSSYQSPPLYYCFAFTLLLLYLLCISIPKIPKILFIISIRSHFRKWPWRDWQPLSTLVALRYCFCVDTRDSSVASYWIDTLVLKNWGKYLRYFAASSLPLQGNPTQCSRGSRDPEAAYEALDELDSRAGWDGMDGFHFRPLGELVDGDVDVAVAPRRSRK